MTAILLVTGGSRGIGRVTAILAAERGYDVAIGYRQDRQAAQAVVEAVESKGRRALAIPADVGSQADIEAMFEAVDNSLGPLTHLVNSAGVSPKIEPEEVDGIELAQLWAINVSGTILCCREAVKRMVANGSGSIVNLSSMAAIGGGRDGAIPYAASKGAVDSYTVGLGKKLAAAGIRVNAVRPGMTITDMTAHVHGDDDIRRKVEATIPMQRLGRASEVAEAILWLLSDASSFVTGSFIDVGGGGFATAGRPK